MTTIKKKSYQPPTIEVVRIDNVQLLLGGSTLDIEIEDDNIDIKEQDAPIMDLGSLEFE